MKNILVSGASGIIGYGILRSLRNAGRDLHLIGTTIYIDSPAEGFCDIFEQALPTNDEGYINWLLTIIKKRSDQNFPVQSCELETHHVRKDNLPFRMQRKTKWRMWHCPYWAARR